MGFNYAREIIKFEKRWKRLKAKYRQLGMSEEAIKDIYEFDREVFKSNRIFYLHNIFVSDLSDSMIEADDYSSFYSRLWWIEEIEDPVLLAFIKGLSLRDIEIITLCMIEGFEQKKAAKKLGIPYTTLNYRYKKIKKILKNIFDFRI